MNKSNNLTLECTAIGSLPHTDLTKAIELVKRDFSTIPFWPQMVKIDKNEDMIFQFLDNMPSFFCEDGNVFLDSEYDSFFEELEVFFNDYEEITADINSPQLEKYGITQASAFNDYIDIIKKAKTPFAKGQIVGPFTLSAALCKKDGTPAIYDETLREIINRNLILKALWQIKKIKEANSGTTPIIFTDEPTLSQLGTSAYVGIAEDEIHHMLIEITDMVKKYGAIPAIHCCGKCDWTLPLNSGFEMINPDAYSFAENLSLFSDDIKKFLTNGGKIAFGIVPTLDKTALEKTTTQDLIKKYQIAVKYLTKNGIDEKLVIENSIITPSCGAGVLTVELAEKAMDLTKELSISLKEIYNIDD